MISTLLTRTYNTIRTPFLFGYIYVYRFYFKLKNVFYLYFPYFKPIICIPKTEEFLQIIQHSILYFPKILDQSLTCLYS